MDDQSPKYLMLVIALTIAFALRLAEVVQELLQSVQQYSKTLSLEFVL